MRPDPLRPAAMRRPAAGLAPGETTSMDRTGDWKVSDPLAVAAAEPVVPSALEFLHYLAESRLFPPSELDAFLHAHPGLDLGDASRLIDALCRQGRLNDFQLGR